MFSLFKRKPREDWRLVKTHRVDVSSKSILGVLYYHLFESNENNRRIEYDCTIPNVNLEDGHKIYPVYHEIIYPWMQGRINPEIPRYSEIPEEETAAMLRGKI